MLRVHSRVGFFVLIFAFVLLLGSATEAKACSCIPERPVCEAFGGSSAVFVGKVTGGAQQRLQRNEDGTTTTYEVGEIYFAVEETFSGVKGLKRVTIHSGTGGGDCGYWFRRGERYLVYAYGSLKEGLSTSICSRTRHLSEAGEDLSLLRQLPVEGSGVKINGMVAALGDEIDKEGRHKVEGIAGITVTITGKRGEHIELVTDSSGAYEISSLKAGEYEVRAALPDYYYKDEYSIRKIKVSDRGCAREDFAAIPNGQISGRVVDAEGNPVKKAKITLIKSDADGFLSMRDELASAYVDDEEGRFKLTRVSPGEYLLVLNVTFSPDAEEPYPPTYYPGVRDRAEATIIKLGLGQKLSGYTLRLPPKLTERVIQGSVVWPDGRPAAEAEVYLTDENHPGWIANGSVKTDTSGRFTIMGFEGIRYWVLANVDSPKEMHAEPPLTSPAGPVSGLRLVLTSEGNICKHYYKEEEDK